MKRRPTRPDRTKPNAECRNCRGKGAYPLDEQKGIYVVCRMGNSKNATPCKECWNY